MAQNKKRLASLSVKHFGVGFSVQMHLFMVTSGFEMFTGEADGIMYLNPREMRRFKKRVNC